MLWNTGRRSTLFALTFFIAIAASRLQAQRLPDGVQPEHYSLTLTPDLKTATFTGEEKIDLVLDRPGTTITLNSAEIKFTSVKVLAAGSSSSQEATVSLDGSKEQATVTFAQPVRAGQA